MLIGRQPWGLTVDVALPDFWGELDYTTNWRQGFQISFSGGPDQSEDNQRFKL